MEQLNAFFANISEQFEAMSTRDRNLATGFIAGVAVLVVGLITWQLQSTIVDRASRVILAKENLMTVQELAQTYEGVQQRLASAEARMGTFQPDSMSTYLDGWASEAGVQLKNVQETDAKVVGAFRERDFRVEVQRGELDGIVKFLHAIETSPYTIKVRSANFKVRDSKKEGRSIDLDLDLIAFSKEKS
jgi:hypothetical protein